MRFLPVVCVTLSFACTQSRTETPADVGTDSAAGSQPSSQAASLPTGHSTSTAAVTLEGLFRLPETPNDVVIQVNELTATRSDLENTLRQLKIELTATGKLPPVTREMILRSAVDRTTDRLMRQVLAKKFNVTVSPKDVEIWLGDLQKRTDANPAFAAFLAQAGKDQAALEADGREAVLMNGITRALKEQKKGELESEAKAYYNKNKHKYFDAAGTEVWRIVIKAPGSMIERDRLAAKARAEDIAQQAKKNPKQFENLARSFSEGGNASQGGFVGWANDRTFGPPLSDKVKKAKPNSVLPIQESTSGFYIYKVGRTRKDRQRTYSEVKNEVYQRIMGPLVAKAVQEELSKLKKEQKVEVNVPELAQKGHK